MWRHQLLDERRPRIIVGTASAKSPADDQHDYNVVCRCRVCGNRRKLRVSDRILPAAAGRTKQLAGHSRPSRLIRELVTGGSDHQR